MPTRLLQPAARTTRRMACAVAVALAAIGGLTASGPAVAQTAKAPDLSSLLSTDGPDTRPVEVRGMQIANKLGDPIPLGLTFTNVDGATVRLGDFFNRTSSTGHKKPVVMMMVYYKCPILCPMVLEKFTRTLNELDFTAGTDFDVVVVSFDPRDKPADAVVKRADQLMFYKQPTTDAVRDGWTFLTCDKLPENAKALADALGFPYRAFPKTGDFSHGAAVFVLTPEGKMSRYLLGLDYPARDVRLALLEAGQGKVGNLIDRFTLWCYHYDPSTGSYALLAMRVMRLGAAACALVLGVFLLVMCRLDRRRRLRAPGGATGRPAVSPDLTPALTPAMTPRA